MKKLLYILCIVLVVSGCATTPADKGGSDYTDAKYTLYYNQGLSQLDNKAPSYAMEKFFEAEKIKKTPELYFSMGQACFMLKRYDLALAYFDRSLLLDKNFSSGNVGKGIVYREMGRYDEALAEFNKALENILFHEPEKAYFNIALTYLAMNDMDKAVIYLKSTIQLKSDFLPAYYRLALTYMNLKNYEAAVDAIKRFLAYAPDSPDARMLLGKAYLKLGKRTSAEVEFREVIRLAPNTDFAREAQVYLMGGDN